MHSTGKFHVLSSSTLTRINHLPSEYRLIGQEMAEYDFRDFRMAKLERLKRGAKPPDGNDTSMAKDEALLEYNLDNNNSEDASVLAENTTGAVNDQTDMPAAPASQITPSWWGMADQNQPVSDGLHVDLSWLLDESGYTEYQTGDPTIFWNQVNYI